MLKCLHIFRHVVYLKNCFKAALHPHYQEKTTYFDTKDGPLIDGVFSKNEKVAVKWHFMEQISSAVQH